MEKNTSIAVKITDLKKSYRGGEIKALDGINLSISTGEIFGLIGPNGAGKTTLIGCMLALLSADSGSVKIFGSPADYLSVLKQTGYMPERVAFEHWMTARQFLEFHHGLSKRPKELKDQEIEEALEKVELAKSFRSRRLKTYSRGMLQRLNLAQVLIGKPTLVLLDEPTLGLDPNGVSIFRTIVDQLRESGTTAIINSHQLDEIERVCDRVAFIQNGKINSIEAMNVQESNSYILHTSWTNCTLNGTLKDSLIKAAFNSNCQIKEWDQKQGRFIVEDQRSASLLLQELISVGIPVNEAIAEKKKLEKLFANSNGVDTNGV